MEGSRRSGTGAGAYSRSEANEDVALLDVRFFMMVDCLEEIASTCFDNGLGLCMGASLIPFVIDVSGVLEVVGVSVRGLGHKLPLVGSGLYVIDHGGMEIWVIWKVNYPSEIVRL